ncbi:unnamed protein product [Linum trigynum]|uniref:Uncharacterized protein n=1 Tax=Linum trigynum TaxID=586398 RepID=A0AAV2EXI6_9ROSI
MKEEGEVYIGFRLPAGRQYCNFANTKTASPTMVYVFPGQNRSLPLRFSIRDTDRSRSALGSLPNPTVQRTAASLGGLLAALALIAASPRVSLVKPRLHYIDIHLYMVEGGVLLLVMAKEMGVEMNGTKGGVVI